MAAIWDLLMYHFGRKVADLVHYFDMMVYDFSSSGLFCETSMPLCEINIVCETRLYLCSKKNKHYKKTVCVCVCPLVTWNCNINLQPRQKLYLLRIRCDYRAALRKHLRKWASWHRDECRLHFNRTRQRPLVARMDPYKSPLRERLIWTKWFWQLLN